MQTKNFMGLGTGKRATERAGGWVGVGVSGHTLQQTRDTKNVTFFGPSCKLRKKEPKKVLFTRLRRNKNRERLGLKGHVGVLGDQWDTCCTLKQA